MPVRISGSLKTLRLFAAVLVGAATLAHALDPYELQNQRHNEPKQPDEIGRPDAGPIGGADIREHRDKVNAVKAQVFKPGATPSGATFRAAMNNGESKAQGYVAEARFSDFSKSVKDQVVKSLGQAPRADQRVAVLVDVQPDAVTVAEARIAGTVPALPPPPTVGGRVVPASVAQLPAAPGQVVAPNAPREGITRVPQGRVQPVTAAQAVSPARPTAPRAVAPEARAANAVAPAAESARPVTTPALPLPMTVRTAAAALVGDRNVALSANTLNLEPTAVIPTPSGRDLSVRTKDTSAGVTRVELSGRSGDLPPVLKAQIQADLGQTAVPAQPDAPVSVTLEIKSDRSVRAVEARAADVPTVSQPRADAAARVSAPAVPAAVAAGAPPRAPEAAAPGVPATAVPPTAVNAPAGRFPALNAAQTLATLSGLNPSTVRLQAPREEKSVAVSVPVREGREVRVEAVRAEDRGAAPTIRAEGRLGDFSPQTRAQVTEKLSQFKADAVVTENSTVALETRPPEGDKVVVTAIAVKPGEPASAKPVLMWREADDRQVAAPEAAAVAAKPVAPAAAPVNPAAAVSVAPPAARAPKPTGLAPDAATLAVEAYGLPAAGFAVKPVDNKGNLKIDPDAAGKPSIPFNFRVQQSGGHDFETTGRPVDFSDAVRQQVYEKLKLAVEDGETWASEVMKGSRQVKVEFEVNPQEADSGHVRVKSVAPTPKDAAVDAAREMGLADGDFFVVNLGAQSLIVLEQGKGAAVRIGEGVFKIVSPDGNAKIFVRPGRAKKDRSAVFMLSRESLKANRMTLIRAGGPAAAAALKAAMEGSPDAGEFIVNVDPASDDKIAIRAMMNGLPPTGPAVEDSKKKPAYGE